MPFNPFDDRPARARSKVVAIYALLLAANIAAWAWAWIAFARQPVLLATALLAYVFGLRHAFDADHIAAIDNVVRKLIQEGKRPHSTGFFFSLGHSTIVVLASLLIAAVAAMQGRMAQFHDVGGVIGTSVSALFLLAIGVVNLFILRGTWAVFRRVRRGETVVAQELDAVLSGHGFLARIFRSLFALVSRSWHMYPVGFLFGLGFDTATEIGVLGISASQAAQGLSWWSILVFPALFTAGMSLVDTTDSALMTGAYGWAFTRPVRKLWYNMTITAASVVVAIFIGGMEALGLIADRLRFEGAGWSFIGRLNEDLAGFGYAVLGIFMLSWLVSVLVYKAKGYDTLPLKV